MAGPLSSEEIEDVVSSVRRLVSNELSPRRLSRDLGADRLLLTPSLRVVSELSPLAPTMPDAVAKEDPPADPEPAVLNPAEPAPEDAVELVEAEWEDEIWVEADQSPLGEVALAAEEAEVLRSNEHILAAATDELSEPWLDNDGTANETPAVDAAGVIDDSRPDETDSGEAGTAAAAVEAELHQPSEPSTQGAFKGAAVQDGAAPHMTADIVDADGTPLAVLDEAALQEIVRQMIREELQGDLGERITRNVRKLVRAEINRALIARDLD